MILLKEDFKIGNLFKEATFDCLTNEFFKLVEPKKYTKYTLEQHMYNYKKHIEPIFSGKLLNEIEPLHV